ncbi:hypothetical protein KIW84_060388, partial [Lathyrus oleraceus]
MPNTNLLPNNVISVPSITRNFLSVSKFAKDNKVYFEFYANKCFVKSQESNMIVLEGFLDEYDLYYFNTSNHNSLSLPFNKFPKLYSVVNNTIVITKARDNANIWHHILGHANH